MAYSKEKLSAEKCHPGQNGRQQLERRIEFLRDLKGRSYQRLRGSSGHFC